MRNQTVTEATFIPDVGPGHYVFRARLRNNSNGAASGWSPVGSIDVAPGVSDLAVRMADSPDPIAATHDLTYTVTVHNAGPDSAGGVTLTDPLPAPLALVSASSSQGSCSEGATVLCDLGQVPAGASTTVTIVAKPSTEGLVENAATVTSTSLDLNGSNDSATQKTRIAPASCTIIGTDGKDYLFGTSGNDVICGLDGHDTLTGLEGDDTILGGLGDDTVDAGYGNDLVEGGPGNDALSGGPGDDTLHGDEGIDTLDGGAGSDLCDVGPDGGSVSNCE